MIKRLSKVILACALLATSFFSNALSLHANEESVEWQLANASLEKVDGNDVYLQFGSGQKAKITFLSDNLFRIDVELKDQKFTEYPEPMANTHTTKMTVKSESDYEEQGVITPTVKDENGVISIEANDINLIVDKTEATMTLKRNNEIIWQEESSLKYNGKETVQTLKTEDDEYFYGGGQQNGYFSHKNRKILIENKSTWVSGGVSSPNPFYMSTKGYGALRNTFQPGSYDFSETALLEHDENRFDSYYFVGNDLKEILNGYIELTGNPMLMPKYAFYQGNANCYNGDGEELIVDGIARAKEYQDNDMPVGWFLPNDGYGCGYGKSTSSEENIKSLRNFVEKAKEYGFISGLWTENDLDKLDSEVKNGGTQMIKTDVAWVGDGYSFGLNAVRQAFEGIENNSNNRGFVVSLDGWAGTQRYAGLWSGDQTGGNWEYIRFHIPTYIGAGLSGNPNVGSDLDGIYGSNNIISTRDFQWKAFTPIEINMDGWTSGAEKNPWYHGEPYTSINRMYLKMKSAFMPYTYTYAKESYDTGTPMVRGLLLEYPDDPFTWGNQTQYEYMWGENLLVAPLYQDTNADEYGNDVRNNIYLPDSNQIWIDYFTGEQYQGGQVINNFDAPLWKLPLFVKNGAILPKDIENNSQLFLTGDEDRIFEVYPAGKTEFNLYDDDGMSQDYKEGQGTTTLITSDAPAAGEKGTATITVNEMSGSFDGMKTDRGTQFIVNVSEKPESLIAKVGNNNVTLEEVTSEEEFQNKTNVYYYNESPELNHYATEGSDFENVKIKTTPKVMVKIDKTNISKNKVELIVKGFVNSHTNTINENDPELTSADVPTLNADTTDNSITLTWENASDKDVKFGLIIDGNDKAIYRNVTSPYVHESLNSGEEHTYQMVVYNSKFEIKGDVQRFSTDEDRYKNVITNTSVTTNSQYGGNVGGYPAINAVDGDESSLWYTNWDDPETYSGTKYITIDLKDAYKLDQLEYFNNGSAQIKDHEIQVSLDGVNFKTVEKSVWARTGEFRVFVDLNGVSARYVKLLSYDRHHNSANEIRIYKMDGTTAFNPASSQGNADISDGDITFLENYMGVTAAEVGGAWMQREPGDFNYNNEIDAYDLAFALSQYGLENTGKKAGGTISLDLDKTELKKGETAILKVSGNSLKDIYAFGTRFTLGNDVINKLDIKTEQSDITKDMINQSKYQTNSSDYVIAMSSKGNATGIHGNQELATITLTAKEDVTIEISNVVPFVVSTGLDMRLAIPGSGEVADVAQLEDIISLAKIDTLNYTNDSVSEYNAAMKAANKVLDNTNATQEEMNNAIISIVKSLANLTTKEPTRVEALRQLVNTINVEATKSGLYVQSDLDKILAIVANAETLISNLDASDEEVNEMIITLSNRLLSTLDANNSADTSNDIFYNFAKQLSSNSVNVFTEETLANVDSAAENFKNDPGKKEELQNAILSLDYVVNVDKTILGTYLDIINKLGYANAEGFIEEIANASDLLANNLATQNEVDSQISKLLTKIITRLSSTDLENMHRDLTELVAKAELMDVSNKTDDSKATFDEALANAKAALEEENHTVESLETAYINLMSSINGLQDKIDSDKEALKDLINKAENIDLSFYTKDSSDKLVEVLVRAKAVLANQSVDQELVDQMYDELNAALNGLEKNPETSTTPDKDKTESGDKIDTGDLTNTSQLMMILLLSLGAILMMRKNQKESSK